jgi:hypothetical protein
MNKIILVFRIIILLFIVYAMYGLTVLFILSYLNQSPYQETHLSFFNFLLPWSITLILLSFSTYELFIRHKSIKTIVVILACLMFIELFSIKWQLNILSWSISKDNTSEIGLILIALLLILFLPIKLTINMLEINKKK